MRLVPEALCSDALHSMINVSEVCGNTEIWDYEHEYTSSSPPLPPTPQIFFSHQCSFKNRDYSYTKSLVQSCTGVKTPQQSSRVHHVSRTQRQQSPSSHDTQLPALKRKPWLAPQYSTAAAQKPSSRCLQG